MLPVSLPTIHITGKKFPGQREGQRERGRGREAEMKGECKYLILGKGK